MTGDQWLSDYAQYFPNLVEKWNAGQHTEVAFKILQYPKYAVPIFCVDLVMAGKGSKDEKLTSFAAILLEAECPTTTIPLWQIKNKVEELREIWDEGTHEAFSRVGNQLKGLPRAAVVIFASTLFVDRTGFQSLMMMGILTGVLLILD